MRCCRSCPTTTSRCRQAFTRISARSPFRPSYPSSCTTSLRARSANWRSHAGSARRVRTVHRTSRWNGDLTRPMRLTSLLPARFRYLTGDDAICARLSRQRRRWLHLDGFERDAGSLPEDLFQLPPWTMAGCTRPAKAACAAGSLPFPRESRGSQIRTEPARHHASYNPPAHCRARWTCKGSRRHRARGPR